MTSTNEIRRSVLNTACGLCREAVAQDDRLYTCSLSLAGMWRVIKRLAAAERQIRPGPSLVPRSAAGCSNGVGACVGGWTSFTYQASVMGS